MRKTTRSAGRLKNGVSDIETFEVAYDGWLKAILFSMKKVTSEQIIIRHEAHIWLGNQRA